MSFSQGAASHFIPLLARLVLAAAFIPAGWNKLTGTAQFTPTEAQILRELGVKVHADLAFRPDATDAAGAAWSTRTYSIHPVVLVAPRGHSSADTRFGPDHLHDADANSDDAQEREAEAHGDEIHDEAVASEPPRGEPIQVDRERQDAPIAPPIDSGAGDVMDEIGVGGSAGALHRITLMVHAQGWPAPVAQAWMATAVELLGGALLVIGLFSRFWGLGLAITMGVAFWLTSWPLLQETSLFALPIPDYNRLFAQAGLFVLAFGVAMTGPGAVSLDRLLFRPAGADADQPAA